MPIIGYFAGARFTHMVSQYSHWIAFCLLAYIGYGMLKEAGDSCCAKYDASNMKIMFTLAIATSIDALAVGVSFAFMQINIMEAALEIGVITFCCSFLGCVFGSKIGSWGKQRAEMLGGIILIGIGCKILAEHFGML